MRIERHTIPTMSLRQLADKYDLTMEVMERNKSLRGYGLPRFHASFRKIEEKDGLILRSPAGNGETEDEAITDYARKISGSFLVYDAMGGGRIDIGYVNIEEE
jgi:hypothetical protein